MIVQLLRYLTELIGLALVIMTAALWTYALALLVSPPI